MDGLEIRPLVRGDLDVLFGERARPSAELWLAAQARGDAYVGVAVLGGQPVAYGTLVFEGYAEKAAIRAGNVRPEFRSRGIGSRLMTHLEDVARGRGRTQVVLGVAKDNSRARSLYERLRYVRCGEKVASWSYVENGQTVDVAVDVWVMQKEL